MLQNQPDSLPFSAACEGCLNETDVQPPVGDVTFALRKFLDDEFFFLKDFM